MTLFYSEELRLLLEICILLLKANRKSISIEELNDISEKHFNISLVSTLLINRKLAISNNNTIQLIFPQWYYEEALKEIQENKFVESLRWDNEKEREGIWLPYYSEKEVERIIKENKYDYLGKDTLDDKIVSGIGDKCIVLEDEKGEKSFHWFNLPKSILLDSNYKNAFGDGYEKAKEILKLHGDWDENNHLKYILFNSRQNEYPIDFVCKENIKFYRD